MTTLRILVATIVHHPQDARILHRQIKSMLNAGHHVTYAAPFTAYDTTVWPEVEAIDLPRASGRNRLHAIRAARKVLRTHGQDADVVLLHDPELLLSLPGARLDCAVVWDVHEDTGAALIAKPWLPAVLRPLARAAVRAAESRAERSTRLLLAETSYRKRFRRIHPVIPNTTYVPRTVPPAEADRVVYVGHLTAARGVGVMIETAYRLAGSGIRLDIVGHGDASARDALARADADGVLRYHGFVPNDKAMALLEGAMCGLSLLQDLPNYRHSMPTKVLEYMAHGIPVITTPLPSAVTPVQVHKCGIVVPFDAPEATAEAVLRLRADPERRRTMGRNGHRAARAHYHWPTTAEDFLRRLGDWADAARPHACMTLGTD